MWKIVPKNPPKNKQTCVVVAVLLFFVFIYDVLFSTFYVSEKRTINLRKRRAAADKKGGGLRFTY